MSEASKGLLDGAFVGSAGTSPFWWNYFDTAAHIFIFLCAMAVGILRVLILYKEYKNPKGEKHDD